VIEAKPVNVSASATDKLRDSRLVAACRDGRKAAFGELAELYQDRAFNIAYRLMGSRDDAAEAVQEAFLKAFRGLNGFRGDSAFYTWFFRIMVNVVRSRQRFRAVRPREHSLDTAPGRHENGERRGTATAQIPAREPDPSEEAARMERKRLVEEALMRLDAEQRTIIVLRDIEGRGYADIGELLGCPRGTVKSRLHRARMALKAVLLPVLDEEAAG